MSRLAGSLVAAGVSKHRDPRDARPPLPGGLRAQPYHRAVSASILTIGNELVSGDVPNTNASWLAEPARAARGRGPPDGGAPGRDRRGRGLRPCRGAPV